MTASINDGIPIPRPTPNAILSLRESPLSPAVVTTGRCEVVVTVEIVTLPSGSVTVVGIVVE